MRANVGSAVGRNRRRVSPRALRRCHSIGVSGRRAKFHRHHTRLRRGIAERRVVGEIFDAMQISFDAELPVVAEAAFDADRCLRERRRRRLIATDTDAGQRDHVRFEARQIVGRRLRLSFRRREHHLDRAQHVRRNRRADFPHLVVLRFARATLVFEREVYAMTRLRRNDRRDRRNESLLHGDDLVDTGTKRRQRVRAIERTVGLNRVEVFEVESDDERVRDGTRRIRDVSKDLQNRRQRSVSLRRGCRGEYGCERERTKTAHAPLLSALRVYEGGVGEVKHSKVETARTEPSFPPSHQSRKDVASATRAAQGWRRSLALCGARVTRLAHLTRWTRNKFVLAR